VKSVPLQERETYAANALPQDTGARRAQAYLLIAVVQPKVIEHDNVADLIVPVDDDRASLVGPTRSERDVKWQPRRYS
jgi:hypothetical protein